MNDQSKHQTNNLYFHKKIGIWGFGIVGTSALNYFDTFQLTSIQILDTKKINVPTTKNHVIILEQNETSIISFLEDNDYILPSPGIKLHNYQKYAHKFLNELDIFQDHKKVPVIAITGTVGKTSITHLLTRIIQETYPQAQAAGNIGYPLLNFATHPETQQDYLMLELSSFQLQYTKKFSPDLAIITNFFSNHLDHHKTVDEYFDAKCTILEHQTDEQQALIPLDLIDNIIKKIPYKTSWALFSQEQPTQEILEKYSGNTIFYTHEKKIYSVLNNHHQEIFNYAQLPAITFDANWLIIIAACNIINLPLTTIYDCCKRISIPDFRLQKIGSKNNAHFYNDSKSTVWQATLQAVKSLENLPIKLFVGGLSKGADRTPLFEKLQTKNVEVYAFGKEAESIGLLCKNFNIPHSTYTTLNTAWNSCIGSIDKPCNVLFSPGGSSFDLFIDYQDRGRYFTKLVNQYIDSEKTSD